MYNAPRYIQSSSTSDTLRHDAGIVARNSLQNRDRSGNHNTMRHQAASLVLLAFLFLNTSAFVLPSPPATTTSRLAISTRHVAAAHRTWTRDATSRWSLVARSTTDKVGLQTRKDWVYATFCVVKGPQYLAYSRVVNYLTADTCVCSVGAVALAEVGRLQWILFNISVV